MTRMTIHRRTRQQQVRILTRRSSFFFRSLALSHSLSSTYYRAVFVFTCLRLNLTGSFTRYRRRLINKRLSK